MTQLTTPMVSDSPASISSTTSLFSYRSLRSLSPGATPADAMTRPGVLSLSPHMTFRTRPQEDKEIPPARAAQALLTLPPPHQGYLYQLIHEKPDSGASIVYLLISRSNSSSSSSEILTPDTLTLGPKDQSDVPPNKSAALIVPFPFPFPYPFPFPLPLPLPFPFPFPISSYPSSFK